MRMFGCVKRLGFEQKNNGAIQKVYFPALFLDAVCYMKGERLHHLGIRLRQCSLYCSCSVTVLFSSTHFPGFVWIEFVTEDIKRYGQM